VIFIDKTSTFRSTLPHILAIHTVRDIFVANMACHQRNHFLKKNLSRQDNMEKITTFVRRDIFKSSALKKDKADSRTQIYATNLSSIDVVKFTAAYWPTAEGDITAITTDSKIARENMNAEYNLRK
jgi:hypothetical protein